MLPGQIFRVVPDNTPTAPFEIGPGILKNVSTTIPVLDLLGTGPFLFPFLCDSKPNQPWGGHFWMGDSGASAWDCWWWLLAPTAGRRWTWCHRSHLGFIGWQKFDWGVGRVCYGAGNLWVRCKTWKMEVSWSLELVLRPFWGTEILLVGGSQTPFFGGHSGGQQLWTQFFMGDHGRSWGGILSHSQGGLPRWFFKDSNLTP